MILAPMGIGDTQLKYLFNGLNYRLIDVAGEVIKEKIEWAHLL